MFKASMSLSAEAVSLNKVSFEKKRSNILKRKSLQKTAETFVPLIHTV